jgi:hypothetical protein
MLDPTVTTTPDTGEPTGYAATAAELRRIADALETLPGAPAYVSLDIQTADRHGTREQIIAGVDAVAIAVLGEPGKTVLMSSGTWHHTVTKWTGSHPARVNVSVYQSVPAPDPKDAEIERLRAELAEARAATANAEAHLGTNGAVAEAKPDTYGVALGRAAVPDAELQCSAECQAMSPTWHGHDPSVHLIDCPVRVAQRQAEGGAE